MVLLSASAEGALPMEEALPNMIVGFLVVFAVLLFLCGVIFLFTKLGNRRDAAKEAEKIPVKAVPAEAESVKEDTVGGEDNAVVAVILAAVAETCGPGARVTSIRKADA